jgi:hypothetical protein
MEHAESESSQIASGFKAHERFWSPDHNSNNKSSPLDPILNHFELVSIVAQFLKYSFFIILQTSFQSSISSVSVRF